MFNNAVTATINVIDWNSDGHGRDAGNYTSGNVAANLLSAGGTNKCLACHDSGVAHRSVANPFRLRNVGTVNQVCTDCHDSSSNPGVTIPGAGGPKTATRLVASNHYNLGSTSNARHNADDRSGGRFCWDCHDPHGTAGNTYMIGIGPNKRLTRRIDTTNFDLGIPFGGTASFGDTTANGRTGAAVVFTATSGTKVRSDYADDVSYNNTKVCETCHDGDSGILHFGQGIAADSHNSPTVCTQCHLHDAGFQGAGDCDSCHEYPPATVTHNIDSLPVAEAAGAHTKHVDHVLKRNGYPAGLSALSPTTDQFTDAKVKIACGTCHTQQESDHMSGTRIINFGTTTTPKALKFGPNEPLYNGSVGVSSSVTLKSCSNLSCHYTETPGWQPTP
jgi:predicted CXXCH cytochrome family protein